MGKKVRRRVNVKGKDLTPEMTPEMTPENETPENDVGNAAVDEQSNRNVQF